MAIVAAEPSEESEMPPLLMTALFSLVLSLVAPHSNVALPHVAKLDQHVVELSVD